MFPVKKIHSLLLSGDQVNFVAFKMLTNNQAKQAFQTSIMSRVMKLSVWLGSIHLVILPVRKLSLIILV